MTRVIGIQPRRLAVLALFALCIPQVLPAQIRADPAAADSCRVAIETAAIDSMPTTVRAYVQRTDGGVLSRDVADLLLQEFARVLRVPRPLHVHVLAPGPASLQALKPERDSTALRELLLDGVYDFTLLADGSAQDIRIRLTTLSPDIDSAVVSALQALSDDHALPMLVGPDAENSVPLRLRMTSGPGRAARARVLFISRVPRVRATDAAPVGDNPTPRYPENERTANVNGFVLAQFVVGANGRVQPGTIDVVQATSRAFMEAALDVIEKLRFMPATVAGCAVAQQVRYPVRFDAKLGAATPR